MRQQEIRFGVRAPDGRTSAVWLAWVPSGRSDVYVAVRSLSGKLKVSLHASGKWREGFTSEFSEGSTNTASQTGDRAREKWERPSEFAPGLTQAFQVIIPARELTMHRRSFGNSPISWQLSPTEDQEVVFTVLLMRSDSLDLEGWPGRDAMLSRLVGRFGLANGETCWITAHEQQITPENLATITQFKTDLVAHRASLGSADEWAGLRAILLVRDTHGGRKYVDIGVA